VIFSGPGLRLMKQLGISAVLGGYGLATLPAGVRAAEWSVTPLLSASSDYDTNRQLRTDSTGSGAGYLTIDLKFRRELEDLQLNLEPTYTVRRFTDSRYGNGDDRTVTAGLIWTGERSLLNLGASYLDQSTLTSEVFQTGILFANTFRRDTELSAAWTWGQTERRSLVSQFNYSDVSYYGTFAEFLPGYKYYSGSAGERYAFNERGSFTVSAYGDILSSTTPGNSSREYGLQGELNYQLTERSTVDIAAGESRRELNNSGSYGTTASIKYDRSFDRDKLTAQYLRSLVPYGTGFLVERQQYSGIWTHSFTEYWDSSLTYTYVKNNDIAVLLRLDRRTYSDLNVSLNYHPFETWIISVRGDYIGSQLADAAGEHVKEWRGGLSVSWLPHPIKRSW
jgi:hypothetical protein